jgi:hypothetical protein
LVQYCDGASFAGSVSQPVATNGTVLYFRGRAILDASIDALMALGLADATDVIIKGCSAGGLATFLHLDYLAGRMPAGARVVGLPDAGGFLDAPDWDGVPLWTPYYQYIFKMQNCSGNVDADCMAHYGPAGEGWKCFFSGYTAPFVTTPMMVINSLADTWQIGNILALPCNLGSAGSCNATELAAVAALRTGIVANMAPILNGSAAGGNGGAFLNTCLTHGQVNLNYSWTHVNSNMGNQSIAQTVGGWYFGRTGVQTRLVDCAFPCDTDC